MKDIQTSRTAHVYITTTTAAEKDGINQRDYMTGELAMFNNYVDGK